MKTNKIAYFLTVKSSPVGFVMYHVLSDRPSLSEKLQETHPTMKETIERGKPHTVEKLEKQLVYTFP